MKSFLNEMEKKFKTVNEAELCEECGMHECKCVAEAITISSKKPGYEKDIKKIEDENPDAEITVEEELEEISTSGGAGSYMTPNAFGKKKKNYKWASVSEAMDKKYEKLIESYSKFAMGKGSKASPSRTVNTTIREVAKKLQEIEQLINYTGRLKNESGMTRAEYGKSTNTALNKISERLLKISERVRRLGE